MVTKNDRPILWLLIRTKRLDQSTISFKEIYNSMTRFEADQEIPVATSVGGNDLTAKLVKDEDEENLEGTRRRGEVQERTCRDALFALLFLAMIIGISVVAGMKGFPALTESNNKNNDHQKISGVLKFTISICAIAVGLSAGAVGLLNAFTEFFIILSLITTVLVSLGVGTLCIFAKNYLGMTLAFLLAAVGICYYFAVQDRIPFATANLRTGVSACRSNLGVFFVAYSFVAGLIFWVFIWMVALFGLLTNDETCDANGKNCHYDINFGLVFLLIISIFWASQVFIVSNNLLSFQNYTAGE